MARSNRCGVPLCLIARREGATFLGTARTATKTEMEEHFEGRREIEERIQIDNATEVLSRATTVIDAKLGDGYAKAHPELLTAFLMGV